MDEVSAPRHEGPWHFRRSTLGYGLIAAVVAAVLAFNVFRPITVLPRIRLAPGFSFVDQDGAKKNSESYRGQVTIYSFLCSRCGTDESANLPQMAALRDRLSQATPAGLTCGLVTMTVDPEHDTPEVLREYAARYKAVGKGKGGERAQGGRPQDDTNSGSVNDTVRWDFLRGESAPTKYVVGGGFGVYYSLGNEPARQGERPGGATLDTRTVIVDGWGILRAEYRSARLDVDRVMRDLDCLAAEVRHRDGLARLAYEAAHLFRCYP